MIPSAHIEAITAAGASTCAHTWCDGVASNGGGELASQLSRQGVHRRFGDVVAAVVNEKYEAVDMTDLKRNKTLRANKKVTHKTRNVMPAASGLTCMWAQADAVFPPRCRY